MSVFERDEDYYEDRRHGDSGDPVTDLERFVASATAVFLTRDDPKPHAVEVLSALRSIEAMHATLSEIADTWLADLHQDATARTFFPEHAEYLVEHDSPEMRSLGYPGFQPADDGVQRQNKETTQ